MATTTLEREWARRGALLRLTEIERERQAILASFPELRNQRSAAVIAGAPIKRRKMSAAARRSMSAGMRRYWARRKAAEAKAKSASK
jgi:hypothetical protein